uniref:Uncharacterized protein n=1 Tax=Romanomermis culicivorax TaxID=13658 RepID=A0A915HET1_ROMCU
PIAKKSVLAPISTQPRPLTSVDQKPAPNAADAAALPNKSLERPKTSRGHMTTTADEESPRKVLGGGSRFLKKTDSVDLKDDIKPTPNAENKAQVLSLDLNATTAAEKKTLLYASLGLSKTNDATITKQNPLTVVAPTITAVKPPLLISEQKPAIATSSVKIESVAAAVKPAVNALAKQDNVKIVEMEKREQEILNASLQERLRSQFKSELEKREKQEKEKMRKEHEILLEKMRDEHKSEKLRIEKDFEEKLIEFKNERQKAEQKKKDEYLLDNGKLINETMLKLQKENNAKLADLKQKLDQDFELEHRKLVVDQEERMSQLKQDLNRQFEEYKLK